MIVPPPSRLAERALRSVSARELGPAIGTGRGAKTLLVIDDDHDFRSLVTDALATEGYRVLEAPDSRSGLELARRHAPDLILCDVCMGAGDDGFATLKGLAASAETAAIPVILMTGFLEAATARRAMALGADDFLPKPFGVATLLEAIAARLERRKAVRLHADAIRDRLLAILEATPDLITIAEYPSGQVVYLNRAARQLAGLGAEEDVTRFHLTDFCPAGAVEELNDRGIPTAVAQGHWNAESTIVAGDGEPVPVSQLLLAHRSAAGRVEFLSSIARDIREAKRAEEQRQLMEVHLRHAQKLESIGQLAAGIAHEINTPTQFIGDNTRFLQGAFADLQRLVEKYEQLRASARGAGAPDELLGALEREVQTADLGYLLTEIPKALQQSLEGVERVARIVRAMKDFSHPGTEEKRLVNLNRAIETTLTVSRNEWKYVADVVTDFAADLPPVPCLHGEFNQVVLNLVVNAAHAIADVARSRPNGKGTISIRTRQVDGWVEIRVSDNGSGIPEKARSRVFDPFFTTKPVGKGSGQGLAIARSVVVDKHGGTITFETEAGCGTTFVVRLPLEATRPASTDQSS